MFLGTFCHSTSVIQDHSINTVLTSSEHISTCITSGI